jgi:signal transduction histidine kinase
MQTLWWRRAIEQRLGTLAAAAILLWTIGTAVAASIATEQIADRVADERRVRAHAIAARIDAAVENELRQLDRIAAAAAINSATLAAEVRGLRLAESVVRIDPEGNVLWARIVQDGSISSPIVRQLPRPRDGGYVMATGELQTLDGRRAFLEVPARESDPVRGSLAAAVAVMGSSIGAMLESYANEPYRVELLDHEGNPIGVSRADGTSASLVGTPMLDAAARLSIAGWEVRLSQPRGEALAPVFVLRRVLVGSSLVLIPFAVLVAWATARSIRQPVLAMTDLAERLARGEFDTAVPPAGEDEIGRLADALEKLRKTLQADERRSLLLKRVISAQEEERRRIARELHDQTTQQLTALKMQLSSAASPDAQTAALLSRSQALVSTMIDDVHRVIYDLRPSMLDDLGLLPAIRAYAERHLAGKGIVVHCEFPPAIPALPAEATTALYRVAQEAVANIARHANAETVMIGCTVAGATIVLEVEDDGVGFDPEQVSKPRETGEGLGLLGMRERLALLGGRVDVESEVGRGTHVMIVLPLPQSTEGVAA